MNHESSAPVRNETVTNKPEMRDVLIDLVGILIVCILILAAGNSAVGRRQIRGIVDNDAVGYATAARELAKTGHVVSHVIYPSTLSQPVTTSRLYMPGFYWNLAIAYKLFGYGTTQSLLVSQTTYCIGTLCTYLIGLRFFNRKTTLAAAGIFSIYPANLYFAQTVMAESSVVAAAAVAFCIFVYLPRRWMPWIGPILVLLPFLYRETGAFMALPMAVVMLMSRPADGETYFRQLSGVALFLALSILLAAAIYASPLSHGRPSLITLDIFLPDSEAERIYRDSVAWDSLKPSPSEWRQTLGKRFVDNFKALLHRYDRRKREATIPMLLPLLVAIPAGLLWGIWKRDPIALGAAAVLLLTMCFVSAFYSVYYDRPLRVAMFSLPLVCLLAGRLWVGFFEFVLKPMPLSHRMWPPFIRTTFTAACKVWNGLVNLVLRPFPSSDRIWPQVIGFICIGAWLTPISFKAFKDMMSRDNEDERGAARVDTLNHDDATVLVGPPQLGIPYLSLHPNVMYSFVPANRKTLDRLTQRYSVTTLILDAEDTIDLSTTDITDNGLTLYRRFVYEDRHYLIFRRQRFAGESDHWKTETEIKWPAHLRNLR